MKGMKKLIVVFITLALLASLFFAFFPVHANISFQDGYESGDFSAWSGTQTYNSETATVVNTTTHTGSYSAKFISNGGTSREKALVMYNVIESEFWARTYINVEKSGIEATDDRFYICEFAAGSDRVAAAGWRNNSGILKWTLLIRDGSSYSITYSTATPVVNTWYCVELHWKKDANAGLGELWINGALVCKLTGKDTTAYGDVSRVSFGFAELINCAASTIFVDCVRISGAYIGPELQFEDGYESGDWSAWTNKYNNPSTSQTFTHDGAYSQLGDDSTDSSYVTFDSNKVNFRAYFYIDAFTSTTSIMRFRAGTIDVAHVYVTGDGHFQLAYLNGNSLTYDTTSIAWNYDTWYCIETQAIIGDSGSFKLIINGEVCKDITGVDNNNYDNLTKANIGSIWTAGTPVAIYSDCAAMTLNGEIIGVEESEYVILKCEFHIHTNASDGDYSPSTVVQIFYDLGYNVIAITDHNTINGVAEAQAKGNELNMIVISGEEISQVWVNTTKHKHIVALFTNTAIGTNKTYNGTAEVEWYFNEVHKQGGIAYAAHPLRLDAWTDTEWKQYQNASFIDGWAYLANNWDSWDQTLFNEYNNFTLKTGKIYPSDHDFHKGTPSDTYYTLIMAHNRTIAGVREALDAKRMVVYDNGEYYGPLWAASLYQQLIADDID